jgi:hypothetical protein
VHSSKMYPRESARQNCELAARTRAARPSPSQHRHRRWRRVIYVGLSMLDSHHLMMATGALEDEVQRSITLVISLDLNLLCASSSPEGPIQVRVRMRTRNLLPSPGLQRLVATKLCIGERTRPLYPIEEGVTRLSPGWEAATSPRYIHWQVRRTESILQRRAPNVA